MRRARSRDGAPDDERAKREGRHLVGRGRGRRGLVENDEDDAVRELRAREQRLQETAEPGVARSHGAVVHVVAQVRHDQREGRQPVGGEVSRELPQRHDPPAPRRTGENVSKVEEGVVLLGIAARVGPGEARPRQPLSIGLPGPAGALQRVGEIPGGDDAARAIGVDALGRAGDEREVVRQTRMGDTAVAGEHGVAGCKGVELRRLLAAEHAGLVLVLHHDHEHVLERRHGRRHRLGAAEADARDQKAGDCEPQDSPASVRIIRFLQK